MMQCKRAHIFKGGFLFHDLPSSFKDNITRLMNCATKYNIQFTIYNLQFTIYNIQYNGVHSSSQYFVLIECFTTIMRALRFIISYRIIESKSQINEQITTARGTHNTYISN